MALGAATVLALAACSGHPGAAAVVDGREITSAQVAEVTDQLGAVLQGVTTANVLAVLVQEPVVTALAAENGVAVSDDEARAALEQAVVGAGAPSVPDLGPSSLAVGRYLVASQRLQELGGEDLGAELLARIGEQDVLVNPRYGTLDERNAVAPPTAPAWIVPEPTPVVPAP